jgi:RNA polymerase sigma factor (sigma-70 family)
VSAAPSLDPSGQASPAPPVLGATEAQLLFERHAPAIYGYCYNRLGGREEAEDAVQTTFLNAFRALRRGVVPEYESAWLYKIAENVCHGRHRSAGRRLEVVQDPTAIAEAAPAIQSERDELIGLDEALDRMAPRQREALLLREWKGLSYREIAQQLQLSPAAVETLLFRARRSLARNLQVGSFIPWLKTLLSGSSAVKAAAAASVVVAGASLGGDAPIEPKTAPARVVPVAVISTPSGGPATRRRDVGGSPGKLVQTRYRAAAAGGRERPSERRRGSQPPGSPDATEPAASTPTGEGPAGDTPATQAPVHPTAPSQPATPPGVASPPPPSPLPLPVQTPQTPPAPPPPTLPQLPPLPNLPSLPPLPPLPPPPALPAVPELPPLPPPLPQLPAVPELPPLPPQLPQLPKLP